jgi:hypothetical protein
MVHFMVIPAVDLNAVAIRHVPFEDLGLVGPILKQAGWSISSRDAPTMDLDDPLIGDADLLIVLGGPIGVYDVEGVRRTSQGDRLGLCRVDRCGARLVLAAPFRPRR